jgi:hypothetical protein
MVKFLKWLVRRAHKFTIEGSDGTAYMTRYTLLKLWGYAIYIHQFHRSDEDDMHDHPFSFVTVILSGGYFEVIPSQDTLPGSLPSTEWTWYPPGAVLRRKAEWVHRVDLNTKSRFSDEPVEAWTLVFRGPKRRDWGFHTKQGWVHWKTYMDQKFPHGWVAEEQMRKVGM